MKNMAILACGLHLNHVLQPLKPFLPSESFIPSAEFIPPIINTPFALGGYFTPDKFRHAIIGNRTGKLHEVFYNPQTGKGTSYLACFDEISCMDSFYTPDDGNQHQIIATPDGKIHEVYFKPGSINYDRLPLGSFNNIVDIASFYTEDDQSRIVIVATADGNIHEIFFKPSIGVHLSRPPLGNFPGVIRVAGFYVKQGNFRTVIVATNDGNIHEIFYNPSIGVHITRPPLIRINGIVDIAAFLAGDDQNRIVIVATNDGNIHEIFYRPDIGVHLSTPPLARFNNPVAVAAFFTPDDKNRIVLVAESDGNVHEIFYNPAIGIHISNPPLGNFNSPKKLEDISPDPGNVDTSTFNNLPSTSSSGRVIGLAGNADVLYALVEKSGVWKSLNGGKWNKLVNSPAITDLYNGCQIAVSPNNNNHVVIANSNSGAWESVNGGVSWSNIFDPSKNGCGSKSVRAVIFGRDGGLFIGTDCSIVHRKANTNSFDIRNTPAPILGFAISQTKIWARSSRAIYVSTNNGLNWSAPIQFPNAIDINWRFTDVIAAFDAFAYIPFSTTGVAQAGGCGTCGADTKLLILNAKTNTWLVQNVDFAGCHACDGTGLSAGPIPIRSFISNNLTLPAVVGKRLQLLFSAGQELYQATGLNSDGTIVSWNRIGGTFAGGAASNIHADIWDFYIDTQNSGNTAWVACDGGVFKKNYGGAFLFPAGNWSIHMDGMHTHKMITLSVLPGSPIERSRLGYPTADNNAWCKDSSKVLFPDVKWQSVSAGGDVNFSVGDAGMPSYLLLARHQTAASLMHFGVANLPITICNSTPGPDTATRFQFIQAPKGMGSGKLDAVMLATLPLSYFDTLTNKLVPADPMSPLGKNSNGNWVMLRNRNFAASPDINIDKGISWSIEINNFPTGTEGFYVSGSPAAPIYYSYGNDGSGLALSKWDGTKWNKLAVTNLMSSTSYGPAFVNPFDPKILYVITQTGILVSNNGGNSFTVDPVLTNLAKGLSGTQPLNTLSNIAFNYDNPTVHAACANWGGIFHRRKDGTWNNLSGLLPSPSSPIISVGIDNENIYVATDGRGLWKITNYKNN